VIFVVANFLQVFWRKTLKNVGFWQKLAPTLLKQKKWQKGKNTDLNTLPYPFVTQCFFGGGELFQVLQKCFNGKVGKLCLLWYKMCKNSPLLRNQKMEEKSKRW